MWLANVRGIEPVYPPGPESSCGFGDKLLGDVRYVKNVSNTDDASNTLACSDTRLPFAQPRFGTSCAATMPADCRAAADELAARVIAAHGNGPLGCGIPKPEIDDD